MPLANQPWAESPETVKGGCYCGGVRFAAVPPFGGAAHCHCSMCRRSHGAAFVTWLVTETERFALEPTATLEWFSSSAQSERGFCGRCGTTLFFRSSVCPGETHVVLAALDEGHGVVPNAHCFSDQQVSWAPIADDLPRYEASSQELARFREITAGTKWNVEDCAEPTTTKQTSVAPALPDQAPLEKANLRDKLAQFDERWSPRIVGELNGQYIKLAKVEGPFVWHHHDDEDELFLVVEGRLEMELRDQTITLEPGEMLIVPKGIEHRPVAEGETHILLFEPKSTLNTGNVRSERTVAELEHL